MPQGTLTVRVPLPDGTLTAPATVGYTVVEPAARTLWGASAKSRTGKAAHEAWADLDAALAAAAGATRPVMDVWHIYEQSIPTSWSNCKAKWAGAVGAKVVVLNVRTDWQKGAAGQNAAALEAFARSKPAGTVLYLILDHEPENDTKEGMVGRESSLLFCQSFARQARDILALDLPDVHVAFCPMGGTVRAWEPTRNPWGAKDYDPLPGLLGDALPEVIYAPDCYVESVAYDPEIWDFTYLWAQGKGFGRFALSEFAQVDARPSRNKAAETAAWMPKLGAWAARWSFEYVAWFHSDVGFDTPGDGPYLDDDPRKAAAYAALWTP